MLQTRWKLTPEFVSRSRLAGAALPAADTLVPFKFLLSPVRPRLEALLEDGQGLGLMWIALPGFSLFEKLYGENLCAAVESHLKQVLERCLAGLLGREDFRFVEAVGAGIFVALFHCRGGDGARLGDLAMRLRLEARNDLNQEVVKRTGQSLSVEVGYAVVPARAGKDLEGLLFNALCDARQVAEGTLDLSQLSLMEEFREIIETPRLGAVYQPIVDLRNGETLGWESLARGPAQSHFASPNILFDFAEEVGSIFALERCCREQAIRGLGGLEPGQKLFLNIHPQTVGDPQFKSGETLRLLARHGLKPYNVVFEITERHNINDFTLFYRTLDHYRSQGYQVAIDDVGTGYSGLSRLAAIRPDYIKVDMSLIRGIDANPVQRSLIETLVTLADKIGCGIICEGIETETELSSLMQMGVHFGQGYHLARPAAPKPQPLRLAPGPGGFRRNGRDWKCSIPVSELAEPAPAVGPEALTREVKHLLDSQPISGVVVVDQGRPVGLLMSHSLDRQLGTYFGTSLYYERSVSRLMDNAPLIVEGATPVEQVAGTAMRRERFKLYDHIIVTKDGFLQGLVSVQKMLDALAMVQVEMARGMNPLSGLPGNVSLEQEVERRCRAGAPVSFVYTDLDNFKVYNDLYGFEAGDQMILLLSRILVWAVRRHAGPQGFVGHVGGDDFVAITPAAAAERVCLAVTRVFKRLVPGLYGPEDRARGWVEGKGRDGRDGRHPLVSVSLGIVDCRGPCDLKQIGRRAAEVKHYAKTRPGNVYVRDRRSPLGQEPQPEPPAAAG
jgi:EAL domain-containing protein (putative c-di-GMP-specific phosphodiesterase class I)/GGDEF domain-containing protein